MSAVDPKSDLCAICAYAVAGGDAMEECTDNVSGTRGEYPVRSMRLALTALAEGRKVFHRGYHTPLPLYAETLAGGTLVCGPHVSYVVVPR